MKIATMRRVDAWAGIPLCWIATLVERLRRLPAGSKAPEGRIRSVLIIKLSELGALITLGPALNSLTRLADRQNLYFLAFAESRELLEVLDYVPRQNIFLLPTDSLWNLIWEAIKAIVRIRRLRIDCSLDLDFFSRVTALLGWLSGCRRRAGCHAFFREGPYRGDLLTHRVRFNPHIHVCQMFEILAASVERYGADFPRIDYVPSPAAAPERRFEPAREEWSNVRHLLAEVGVKPGHALILLNSNISDRELIPLRKWSDERYVALAKMILEKDSEAFVLLTGGRKEAGAIGVMETQIGHPRCRSVAGRTTLRELLTLYSLSGVLVTNDSGPAHFATLTDIDIVVLFGPETHHLWRPLGERVHVVSRNLACSPCFSVYNGRQSQCRNNACMDIAPAEVHEIVRKCLAMRLEKKNPAGI